MKAITPTAIAPKKRAGFFDLFMRLKYLSGCSIDLILFRTCLLYQLREALQVVREKDSQFV
jgi:hypothetical protein